MQQKVKWPKTSRGSGSALIWLLPNPHWSGSPVSGSVFWNENPDPEAWQFTLKVLQINLNQFPAFQTCFCTYIGKFYDLSLTQSTFTCKNTTFSDDKVWPGFGSPWIRIGSCLWIWIRICIEILKKANADPQVIPIFMLSLHTVWTFFSLYPV